MAIGEINWGGTHKSRYKLGSGFKKVPQSWHFVGIKEQRSSGLPTSPNWKQGESLLTPFLALCQEDPVDRNLPQFLAKN